MVGTVTAAGPKAVSSQFNISHCASSSETQAPQLANGSVTIGTNIAVGPEAVGSHSVYPDSSVHSHVGMSGIGNVPHVTTTSDDTVSFGSFQSFSPSMASLAHTPYGIPSDTINRTESVDLLAHRTATTILDTQESLDLRDTVHGESGQLHHSHTSDIPSVWRESTDLLSHQSHVKPSCAKYSFENDLDDTDTLILDSPDVLPDDTIHVSWSSQSAYRAHRGISPKRELPKDITEIVHDHDTGKRRRVEPGEHTERVLQLEQQLERQQLLGDNLKSETSTRLMRQEIQLQEALIDVARKMETQHGTVNQELLQSKQYLEREISMAVACMEKLEFD